MFDEKITLLLLVLSISTLSNLCISQADACPDDLSGLTWTYSDVVHNHGSGEHTHTNAAEYWTDGKCHLYGNTRAYLDLHKSGDHLSVSPEDTSPPEPEPKPEPEPEPPYNPQPENLINDAIDWLEETPGRQTPEELMEFIQSHPDYVPLPPEIEIGDTLTRGTVDDTLTPETVAQLIRAESATPDPVVPKVAAQRRLTPEEIERLPVQAQQLIQSLPDAAKLTIDIVPTAETLGSEQGQILHIHTTPESDPFAQTESTAQSTPQTEGSSDVPEDETEENVFLENVQFLVFAHPIVTEYMLRGWSKGKSNLPRWIELYNPHDSPVNLKGWKLKYVEKGKVKTLPLKNFHIPADGVGLLVSHEGWKSRYIGDDAVYILDIPKKALESGWLLLDAEGTEIHRIGVAFRTDALPELSDPVNPDLVNHGRVSHNRYASELPPRGGYYYGHSRDIGTPGFFQVPVAAAPSKARPKLQTSWGAIKRKEPSHGNNDVFERWGSDIGTQR